MKINKITILLATLLAMVSTACDDALNLDPLDQIGGNKMWRNASDYKQFSNNFYGWTRDFSSVLDGWHQDRTSDLITYQTYNDISHGSNTIPSSDGDYTNNYKNIRRCNMLLKNAENYRNPDEIAQYRGEAYFFRAYCYYELLQKFGDVVVTTEVLDVNSPEMNQKRNDRSEVISLIVDDLLNAAELLPKFSAIEDGYARISSEGAYAFLSRAALYEGT